MMRRITSVVISCLLLIGLTLAGCVTEGDNVVTLTLTISSTIGGSVTTPGEGTFFYDAGTTVNLVAEVEEGYQFVNWTDNVDTIADVDAASTTIIMNDDYSIGADFAAISPVQYNLTISSTSGGSVTVPGEAMFTYDEGTLVDLVATPDAVHQFVNWTGDVGTVANINASATTITILSSYSIAANFEGKYTRMVTGGYDNTVGLKSDGTVVAVGSSSYGQCNVSDWIDIIQVDGGYEYMVGLKSDGTVVAVGNNAYGQCNVGKWTDITQVVAGRQHTVGLKSDGTVVATGDNTYGQCNVSGWTDIIQIAAGANSWHTVGRRSDGTVVAAGGNWGGQCDVGGWIGIIQVATGGHHTVGLKADGTVVAVGRDNHGETNVGDWTDIVQIAGGCQLTIALKPDGTVVTAGWNDYGQRNVDGWTDIIQVAAGMLHTMGLRSDGSVVAAGGNWGGQCDVEDWMLT